MAAADDVPRVIRELWCYIRTKLEEIGKERKEYNSEEDVIINVGVTGESGVGKSTFVNALLGMEDGEPGAAKTGVTETIKVPMRYPHPSVPNVFIWDLPGTATPNFRVKNYLRNVNFEMYDFFIFIGAVRFKENDVMLADEIQKRGKMFYFVRSKIDHDIFAESRKKNFNEDAVLNKIRESCQANLSHIGKKSDGHACPYCRCDIRGTESVLVEPYLPSGGEEEEEEEEEDDLEDVELVMKPLALMKKMSSDVSPPPLPPKLSVSPPGPSSRHHAVDTPEKATHSYFPHSLTAREQTLPNSATIRRGNLEWTF